MTLTRQQWYLAAAIFALLLYLMSGPMIYMTTWAGWPSIKPLGILSGLAPLLILARLWYAVRGILPLRGWPAVLGASLLVWLSLIQGVTYFTQAGVIGEAFALTAPRTFTAMWVLWLGVEAFTLISPRRQGQVLWGAFLALCATGLYGINQGIINDGQPVFDFFKSEIQFQFDYVSITDPIAILGIMLLSRVRASVAVLLGLGVTALLFLCYSRTSLAFFLAGAAIVSVTQVRSAGWWRAVMLVGLLSLAGVALTGGVEIPGIENLQTSIDRMGIVATDLGDDSSYQARTMLMEEGMADLGKYWLTGQFLADAVERVRGEYVHNWLSFWICYGLGPFVLSIVVMISGIRQAWQGQDRAILALAVVAAGACILSRSYVWTYIWLALSLAVHSGSTWAAARRTAPAVLAPSP